MNSRHPHYVPLAVPQMRLYYALREAVPVIDAAIFKIVRLTGGFRVECTDSAAQTAIDEFIESVPVGGNRQGVSAFISTYFEQLLTCGTALGDSQGHGIVFDGGINQARSDRFDVNIVGVGRVHAGHHGRHQPV